MNNLPKHHGAGPAEAWGPMQLRRLHRLKTGPACTFDDDNKIRAPSYCKTKSIKQNNNLFAINLHRRDVASFWKSKVYSDALQQISHFRSVRETTLLTLIHYVRIFRPAIIQWHWFVSRHLQWSWISSSRIPPAIRLEECPC